MWRELVLADLSDFEPGKAEKKQTDYKIETGEPNQGEDRVTVANDFTKAVARMKKPVDQPWLPSELGSHPTERVCDVWVGKGQ